MTDVDIFGTINELSSEEERLYGRAGDGSGLSAAERERLDAIKVELERCFDLLHQRQGRRDAGDDPESATARFRGGRRGLPAVVPDSTAPGGHLWAKPSERDDGSLLGAANRTRNVLAAGRQTP